MVYELTNEEKRGIVEQHLKNIAFSEYNLVLSLTSEEALENPNSANLLSLNSQKDDLEAQRAALLTELNSLV
jgi:hypothetical protein